jgi:Tfp pilus assembly protein PilN
MTVLNIDLAPRSFLRILCRTRLYSWVLAIVGVVLLGVAITALYNLIQLRDIKTAELQRLLKINQERTVITASAAKPRPSVDYVNALNDAIGRLNFPWQDMFNTIEETTPDTIALLSLEVDARTRKFKALAEARDSNEMLSYIERIRGHKNFASVSLLRHDTDSRHPNKPLRFQFDATWAEVNR